MTVYLAMFMMAKMAIMILKFAVASANGDLICGVFLRCLR